MCPWPAVHQATSAAEGRFRSLVYASSAFAPAHDWSGESLLSLIASWAGGNESGARMTPAASCSDGVLREAPGRRLCQPCRPCRKCGKGNSGALHSIDPSTLQRVMDDAMAALPCIALSVVISLVLRYKW